jgi:hypothetical protein
LAGIVDSLMGFPSFEQLLHANGTGSPTYDSSILKRITQRR